MAVFGLCFGNAFASVAAYRDGRWEVLANEFGERATPTLVTYLENEKLVGHAAKQSLHRHAGSTACCMVLLAGNTLEDECIQSVVKELPCKVVKVKGETCYHFTVSRKDVFVPVQEPMVEIFKKLHTTAKSFDSESPLMRAVVAAPADYSEEQRDIIRASATAAGFDVLRVISEAPAACLAHGIGQNDRGFTGYVLVYNLGMWTLSVTLLHVVGGLYRTLASRTLPSVGGRLIDTAVVDLLANEVKRQWKVDIRSNVRAMYKLKAAAELAKHTLATNQTASVHVESLHEGMDFQYTLSRGRFDGSCTPLRQSCLHPIFPLLQETGVTREQLSHIVLAGGSCKIPWLQQLLKEEFPSSEVLSSISPDEVIVVGCAMESGILGARYSDGGEEGDDSGLVPCTPEDIWLACVDSEDCSTTQLLPKHTPLPCQRTATVLLKPTAPQQEEVCVEVREGSSASERVIAKLFVPVATERISLDVSIQWLKDNVAIVTAKELSSDWTCSVDLHCEQEAITI